MNEQTGTEPAATSAAIPGTRGGVKRRGLIAGAAALAAAGLAKLAGAGRAEASHDSTTPYTSDNTMHVDVVNTTLQTTTVLSSAAAGRVPALEGTNNNAAVPHPDGSHRLLYCQESPEPWFEDFGEAKLVGGKAEVKLDPDFAAVVHSDGYRVFLTAEGDSKGLYMAGKSSAGFEVRESQGGTSSLGFSYRAVAKRKDITGQRLAKVKLPEPIKELRKPPEPPKAPELPETHDNGTRRGG